MVAGVLTVSPSANLTMIARRTLPDRVFGSQSTTTACFNAATGPIWSRTRPTHSVAIASCGLLTLLVGHTTSPAARGLKRCRTATTIECLTLSANET